ncbi:putative inactive receptor kinase [Dorcoceras hygrometricum]|uniref:Putative inactive receptor kinase n=1 Tax=Dorcoceras hygrometricum TaxID=472368 RepID=A0A2Z7B5T6_9LAMI|nr:putative inactive receptor kinase [Dorcoceras hygrometricum]
MNNSHIRDTDQAIAELGRTKQLRAVQIRTKQLSKYTFDEKHLFYYVSSTHLMTLMLGNRDGSGSRLPARQRKNKSLAGRRSIQFINNHVMTIHRVFLGVTFLATRAWLRPVSRGNRHFTVGGGRLRQSGPRSEGRLLRQPALEGLTRSARTDSPRQVGRNKFRRSEAAVGQGGGGGGF